MNKYFSRILSPPWLTAEHFGHRDPYASSLHRHPAWQLSIALGGTLFFLIRGEKITLKPGEWILLSPGLLHDAGSETRNSECIQIFFRHFPPESLPEPAAWFNASRGRFLTGAGVWQEFRILANRFQRLDRTGKAPFPISSANLLSMELVMTALRNLTPSDWPCSSGTEKLRSTLAFMEDHYPEPLGVGDFAEQAGVSCRRLTVLFQEVMKESPMHFFNMLRLGHAQEMLLQGRSVRETAELCGFANAQYFCRFFRKNTGVTPGEFRKSPFEDGKRLFLPEKNS